jgi:thiol-disulfide isomerase/thioredoxin
MAERRKVGKAQAGAGVAIAAALFTTVYLALGGNGNGGDAGTCRPDETLRAALDPLVKGEVAALQLAREPQDLSGLAFTDADGQPATLAAFRGKVVLVNLWATWCAPCRQEMPALDRLQAAEGGDDFTVVPVSIDTGERARAAQFLDSVGVNNLPLYTDPTTEIFGAVKQRGLALGLPVTLLVGRDGCHIGHMNGPAEWDSDDGRAVVRAAVGAGDVRDKTAPVGS